MPSWIMIWASLENSWFDTCNMKDVKEMKQKYSSLKTSRFASLLFFLLIRFAQFYLKCLKLEILYTYNDDTKSSFVSQKIVVYYMTMPHTVVAY